MSRFGMPAVVRGVAALAIVATAAGWAGAARLDHRRIALEGFRVHLVTGGKGAPAVVFDSGLGAGVEAWSEVLPKVAEVTRVVAWDRAGVGRSEPGPGPRTSATIAGELREALRRAEIPPPYVLVGHSAGGFNVRLFASRFPDETAGLILVDATPEEFPEEDAELMGPAERARLATALNLQSQGVRDEYAALETSVEQIRRAPPLPARPVIVMTSEEFEGSPERRALWHELQRRLTARIPGSIQVWAAGSGHRIAFDHPKLVIEAVELMLEAVRDGRPLRESKLLPPPGRSGTGD